MTKGEITMQLTLALIEKGQYYVDDGTNEAVGKAITALYNEISKNIDVRGRDEN